MLTLTLTDTDTTVTDIDAGTDAELNSFPALQCFDWSVGKWIEVERGAPRDIAVVFGGESLNRLINGDILPEPHRVVSVPLCLPPPQFPSPSISVCMSISMFAVRPLSPLVFMSLPYPALPVSFRVCVRFFFPWTAGASGGRTVICSLHYARPDASDPGPDTVFNREICLASRPCRPIREPSFSATNIQSISLHAPSNVKLRNCNSAKCANMFKRIGFLYLALHVYDTYLHFITFIQSSET